jgi:MYXO-CTERM domain-containing protein
VTQIAAVPGPVAGAGLIPLLGLAGAWYARRRKQLAA